MGFKRGRYKRLTKPKRTACEICNLSVATDQLNRHKNEKHGYRIKIQCNECDKTFYSDYTLRIHQESAHEGVRYQCESCPKSFTLPQNLKTHVRLVHNLHKKTSETFRKPFSKQINTSSDSNVQQITEKKECLQITQMEDGEQIWNFIDESGKLIASESIKPGSKPSSVKYKETLIPLDTVIYSKEAEFGVRVRDFKTILEGTWIPYGVLEAYIYIKFILPRHFDSTSLIYVSSSYYQVSATNDDYMYAYFKNPIFKPLLPDTPNITLVYPVRHYDHSLLTIIKISTGRIEVFILDSWKGGYPNKPELEEQILLMLQSLIDVAQYQLTYVYVQNIPKQECDSMDCVCFVIVYLNHILSLMNTQENYDMAHILEHFESLEISREEVFDVRFEIINEIIRHSNISYVNVTDNNTSFASGKE